MVITVNMSKKKGRENEEIHVHVLQLDILKFRDQMIDFIPCF